MNVPGLWWQQRQRIFLIMLGSVCLRNGWLPASGAKRASGLKIKVKPIKGFSPRWREFSFQGQCSSLDFVFSFVPCSPLHLKDVCYKLWLGILYDCPGVPQASAHPGFLSQGPNGAGDRSFSGGLGVSMFVSPATGNALPLIPGMVVFSWSLRS